MMYPCGLDLQEATGVVGRWTTIDCGSGTAGAPCYECPLAKSEHPVCRPDWGLAPLVRARCGACGNWFELNDIQVSWGLDPQDDEWLCPWCDAIPKSDHRCIECGCWFVVYHYPGVKRDTSRCCVCAMSRETSCVSCGTPDILNEEGYCIGCWDYIHNAKEAA
jgi:hypothetical protein